MTLDELEAEKARLEKEITAAFKAGDHAQAETLLRELVPLDHENFVPWYNLACALSMQGKVDDAVKMLKQAIARGFADLRQMERDEHLAGVRSHAEYKGIIEHWTEIAGKRAAKMVDEAKRQFRVGQPGSAYVCETDDQLGLVYVSAFDAKLFAMARTDTAKLEKWWRTEVAGEPTGKAVIANPVLVILPTRPDFIAWAKKRYGERYDRVGGMYSHGERLLVSMDVGSSWRHEFWHVLHWRDMDARGQRHPFWVMEGLCSVVEDCDTGPEGEMVPLPNWRTNIARRLARAGNMMPLDVFLSLDGKRFMASGTNARYAQARALCMYLHSTGKLKAWYAAYVEGFKADETGKEALEKVYGQPLKQIEREFRAWVKELAEVPDEVGRGPANLPADFGPGSGEGPEVRLDLLEAFRNPGRPIPDPSGLRNGDVVTAINDEPVRDLNDLARVLAKYRAGQAVNVDVLRGKKHVQMKVVLVGPR